MVNFLLLSMCFLPPEKLLPLTPPELAQSESSSGGEGLFYETCAGVICGWVPRDFVHDVWFLILSLLQLWLSFLWLPECGHASLPDGSNKSPLPWGSGYIVLGRPFLLVEASVLSK